jgi:hypothetical protein
MTNLTLPVAFVWLAILGLVGMTLLTPNVDARYSAEWCEQHNGSLYLEHSVMHGGTHCELPNGTTKHVYLADRINGASA